jgi:hypothetical protein
MSHVWMEIATERYIDDVMVTILRVTGTLDGTTFGLLVNSARRLVEQGECNLVIDLEGVTEMGSAGLIALHQVARLLHGERPVNADFGWNAFHALEVDLVRGQSIGLHILRPSAAAIDALVTSGFAALIEPHLYLETAVDAFRRQHGQFTPQYVQPSARSYQLN